MGILTVTFKCVLWFLISFKKWQRMWLIITGHFCPYIVEKLTCNPKRNWIRSLPCSKVCSAGQRFTIIQQRANEGEVWNGSVRISGERFCVWSTLHIFEVPHNIWSIFLALVRNWTHNASGHTLCEIPRLFYHCNIFMWTCTSQKGNANVIMIIWTRLRCCLS